MAVAMKSVASGAVRPARRTTVKCQAGMQKIAPTAIAAIAAASLVATPAFAGVVVQQPQLKKVFQESGAAASKESSEQSALVAELPKPKKAPEPKAESSGEGFGIDAQLVSLPLSLAGIAGGYFVLSKLDEGFADVVKEGAMKDSIIEGAGYEAQLKAEGGAMASYYGLSTSPAKGTKKVKAGTAPKKGGFTLFGK